MSSPSLIAQVPDCNNHGNCFNGECQCSRGYTGSACQQGEAFIMMMIIWTCKCYIHPHHQDRRFSFYFVFLCFITLFFSKTCNLAFSSWVILMGFGCFPVKTLIITERHWRNKVISLFLMNLRKLKKTNQLKNDNKQWISLCLMTLPKLNGAAGAAV